MNRAKDPSVVADRRSPHWQVLSALILAFFLRVVAQAVQSVSPVGFLPSFDSFQSGALPYRWLLVSQLAILAVAGLAIARSRRHAGPWPVAVRTIVSLFGAAYADLMLFRFGLGLTDRWQDSWFDEPIPTVFHLVLAAFVLTIAHQEWSKASIDRSATAELVSVTLFPLVLISALCLFAVLTDLGVAATVAAYLSVALGTIAILGAEWFWPAVPAWRPSAEDLGNDAIFLVAVQMLLPIGLAVVATATLGQLFESVGLQVESIWPHRWPVPVQVIMMLLIGDVLRYWLHRASHQPTFLWRLHAVHHSPDRLYSLNVARFHPFDKALQYLFDALPFVILAVDRQVLLGYFVFYGINGFFQHSNCYVRLGPLNWVISGPELHRWHHSKVIAESDNNFGNNLIIWDVLFGTRLLPAGRQVGELGLLNRTYPSSFVAQMTSVFTPGLDKKPTGSKPTGSKSSAS